MEDEEEDRGETAQHARMLEDGAGAHSWNRGLKRHGASRLLARDPGPSKLEDVERYFLAIEISSTSNTRVAPAGIDGRPMSP